MPRNAQRQLHLVEFTPTPTPPERREGRSDREEAARSLHHAVRYLMVERARGGQHSMAASREAVALLCAAAEELTKGDRPETTRRYTLGWLWNAIGWTK